MKEDNRIILELDVDRFIQLAREVVSNTTDSTSIDERLRELLHASIPDTSNWDAWRDMQRYLYAVLLMADIITWDQAFDMYAAKATPAQAEVDKLEWRQMADGISKKLIIMEKQLMKENKRIEIDIDKCKLVIIPENNDFLKYEVYWRGKRIRDVFTPIVTGDWYTNTLLYHILREVSENLDKYSEDEKILIRDFIEYELAHEPK